MATARRAGSTLVWDCVEPARAHACADAARYSCFGVVGVPWKRFAVQQQTTIIGMRWLEHIVGKCRPKDGHELLFDIVRRPSAENLGEIIWYPRTRKMADQDTTSPNHRACTYQVP